MSNKLNYLDKKGLAKVFSILKFGHKKIWHGTLAEWEALSATEKAKYDQAEVIDEYTGVPVVVDKVESGNLNPVTSNAVANWYPRPDWANAVAISAAQLYAGYTAPSDGMIVLSGVMPLANDSNVRTITVNNVPIVKGQYLHSGEYSYGNNSCPVSEGDLIKANISSAWGAETRYFVPYKAQ